MSHARTLIRSQPYACIIGWGRISVLIGRTPDTETALATARYGMALPSANGRDSLMLA